jgi:hypothetical protein
MRKLIVHLLITLITLITLQAAFAAAGSACLHEQDAGAHHLGHHAHQHRPAASDHTSGVDSAGSTDLDQDHDCTTCHANALTGVLTGPHWPSPPEGAALLAEASPFHLSPPPPARPERPNWSGVA